MVAAGAGGRRVTSVIHTSRRAGETWLGTPSVKPILTDGIRCTIHLPRDWLALCSAFTR